MGAVINTCVGLPMESKLVFFGLALLAVLEVKNGLAGGNATHGCLQQPPPVPCPRQPGST